MYKCFLKAEVSDTDGNSKAPPEVEAVVFEIHHIDCLAYASSGENVKFKSKFYFQINKAKFFT